MSDLTFDESTKCSLTGIDRFVPGAIHSPITEVLNQHHHRNNESGKQPQVRSVQLVYRATTTIGRHPDRFTRSILNEYPSFAHWALQLEQSNEYFELSLGPPVEDGPRKVYFKLRSWNDERAANRSSEVIDCGFTAMRDDEILVIGKHLVEECWGTSYGYSRHLHNCQTILRDVLPYILFSAAPIIHRTLWDAYAHQFATIVLDSSLSRRFQPEISDDEEGRATTALMKEAFDALDKLEPIARYGQLENKAGIMKVKHAFQSGTSKSAALKDVWRNWEDISAEVQSYSAVHLSSIGRKIVERDSDCDADDIVGREEEYRKAKRLVGGMIDAIIPVSAITVALCYGGALAAASRLKKTVAS